MQNVGFSGTFKFNATDEALARQHLAAAQAKLEAKRTADGLVPARVTATSKLYDGKFSITTAPSESQGSTSSKNKEVDDLDIFIKAECDNRATQFAYSFTHKGTLGKALDVGDRITDSIMKPLEKMFEKKDKNK